MPSLANGRERQFLLGERPHRGQHPGVVLDLPGFVPDWIAWVRSLRFIRQGRLGHASAQPGSTRGDKDFPSCSCTGQVPNSAAADWFVPLRTVFTCTSFRAAPSSQIDQAAAAGYNATSTYNATPTRLPLATNCGALRALQPGVGEAGSGDQVSKTFSALPGCRTTDCTNTSTGRQRCPVAGQTL